MSDGCGALALATGFVPLSLQTHGAWAAGSEAEVVKAALRILQVRGAVRAHALTRRMRTSPARSRRRAAQDAGCLLAANSAGSAGRVSSLKRVSVTFGTAGASFTIALDRDRVYIVRHAVAAVAAASSVVGSLPTAAPIGAGQ